MLVVVDLYTLYNRPLLDCAASTGLEFGFRFELLLKAKTELGSSEN